MWAAAALAVVAGGAGVLLLLTRDDGGTTLDAVATSVPAEATPSPPPTSGPVPSTSAMPVVATTSPPTTLSPPTTVPPTTVAVTTVPATVAPTTPPPLVPLGWRQAAVFPDQAYPRLFDSNWLGEPSPPLADVNAPLADGRYRVDVGDIDPATGQIGLSLNRFEQCTVLGEPGCSPGPWDPSEVGVTDEFGSALVPLDTNLEVSILGWTCDADPWTGSGPDFDDLVTRFQADYDTAFGPGLAAGTDPAIIMDQVRATPTAGFGPPPAECDDGFALQWDSGVGPTVLTQFPFDFGTGNALDPLQILVPTMLEIDGPIVHLYIYAGFYS